MKKIILLTIGCFLMTAVMGFADMDRSRGSMKLPHGKWWRVPKIVEIQKITPEEQVKLDTLYIENRRQLIDLKGNLQKELLELEILFDQADFNQNACTRQYKKVQEARTKLSVERFKFVIQVRELLGLERFRQLESKYREFRKLRKGKRGKRGAVRKQKPPVQEGSVPPPTS